MMQCFLVQLWNQKLKSLAVVVYCRRTQTWFITRIIRDENQIKEAFINGGRGHPPSHLKFFLLVFSKLKEDIK